LNPGSGSSSLRLQQFLGLIGEMEMLKRRQAALRQFQGFLKRNVESI
jgi:hypothetical protein